MHNWIDMFNFMFMMLSQKQIARQIKTKHKCRKLNMRERYPCMKN